MEGLRQAVFSVITAAVVCGIAGTMVQGKASSQILRMLCGIVTAVTLLTQFRGFGPESYGGLLRPITRQAEAFSAQGEACSRQALEVRITAECQAYILDKATGMGASITAEVILDGGELPVPERVVLRGTISKENKARLSQILTEELGIPKEAQLWIG